MEAMSQAMTLTESKKAGALEYAAVIRFYEGQGIPISEMVTAGSFEGGDFMIVEPGVARLAASVQLGEKQRARLESAHESVARASGPAVHRQADSRFHLTVAALTGSPRVVEAVTSVQATLHEMLLAIPVLAANIAHSDRQHAALVKSIPRG